MDKRLSEEQYKGAKSLTGLEKVGFVINGKNFSTLFNDLKDWIKDKNTYGAITEDDAPTELFSIPLENPAVMAGRIILVVKQVDGTSGTIGRGKTLTIDFSAASTDEGEVVGINETTTAAGAGVVATYSLTADGINLICTVTGEVDRQYVWAAFVEYLSM